MCKYEEIEGWRLSNGKTIRETNNAVHDGWNESTWKRGRKAFPCRILKTEKPILLILMEAM